LSLSSYETQLLGAAHAVSDGQLGADLRRFHPGRRNNSLLAGMELNHPPPIQRTVRILFTARDRRFDLQLRESDNEYLTWVRDVDELLRSLADAWWDGINLDIRSLPIDADDAPPLTLLSPQFPGLRGRARPLRSTSPVLGATATPLSALSRAWHEAQQTPAFEIAAHAAAEVRESRAVRRALIAIRAEINHEFRSRPGSSPKDEPARIRQLLEGAYSSTDRRVRDAATGLKAYNELVHASLAFILGFAEEPLPPIGVEEGLPVTVNVSPGVFSVQLTLQAPSFVGMPAAFTIGDGGPLDGIYLCAAYGLQFGNSSAILDLSGDRIAALER
jgi:hypothetical protein